jgi:S-adenosyl-L-methionine hydrolase (adenosine-forming)
VIFLYTDFGAEGPYLGQVKGVLMRLAPAVPVIDLVSNAPRADPTSSAYLLGALIECLPADCIVFGVVDPGVGGQRAPIAVQADGRWLVGPDNGLFEGVMSRANRVTRYLIEWQPEHLSASFHGRDLFAPVAARIARGDFGWAGRNVEEPVTEDRPDDLDRIIYFDVYGNAYTGRRYTAALKGKTLEVTGRRLAGRNTFGDVPEGDAFWYCNSIGLVELAVNRGSAKEQLGLAIGTGIDWID